MNDQPGKRVIDGAANPIDEWWAQSEALRAASDHLLAHTLYMAVLVNQNEKLVSEVFSGCAIWFRDWLLWLTAGHSLAVIERLKEFPPERTTAVWLAFSGAISQDHPGFPVDLPSLFLIPVNSGGVDVGVAFIRELPSGGALSTLPDWQPLLSSDLEDTRDCQPEGFFLAGAPLEFLTHGKGPRAAGKPTISANTAAVALPVRQVFPPFDHVESTFYANRDAFFGELIAFDQISPHIQSVKGMSGGPVFGVWRDGASVSYALWGIQSAWAEGKRLIRATPRAQICYILERIAERLQDVGPH